MLGCFSPKLSSFFLPVFLLCTSSSSLHPSDSPAVAQRNRERTLLATTFTQEKLAFWQKRLKLQDWDISIALVRSTGLKPETLGNIHWDLDEKTAVIRVLDPADYRMPLKDMLDDMEVTVVHELIHLDLAPVLREFSRSEANQREEEQTVNRMTEALLSLHRDQESRSLAHNR